MGDRIGDLTDYLAVDTSMTLFFHRLTPCLWPYSPHIRRQHLPPSLFSVLPDTYTTQHPLTHIIGNIPWTTEEERTLRSLPRKEILVTNKRQVLLTLADLLFAGLYDIRINEGDINAESAWTICAISPALSWLEVTFQPPPQRKQTLLIHRPTADILLHPPTIVRIVPTSAM